MAEMTNGELYIAPRSDLGLVLKSTSGVNILPAKMMQTYIDFNSDILEPVLNSSLDNQPVDFPISSIRSVIAKFDYRKNINEREVWITTPHANQFKISQHNNPLSFTFDTGSPNTLQQPISLHQKMFKNFVRTVGINSLQLLRTKSSLFFYLQDESKAYEFLLSGGSNGFHRKPK